MVKVTGIISIIKANNHNLPFILHIGQTSSEGCDATGNSSSTDWGEAACDGGQVVGGEQEDCAGEQGRD